MTDNEIIKALECCGSNGDVSCLSCPYEIYQESCINFMGCKNLLLSDSIALINRLKAEIEELREINQSHKEDIPFLIAVARAEAIKEFCEERGIEYVENDI